MTTIDQNWPRMTILDKDGNPLGLPDSDDPRYVLEKCISAGPGLYRIRRPDAFVTVIGNEVDPAPAPAPEPQPEPTPDPVPQPEPNPIPAPPPISSATNLDTCLEQLAGKAGFCELDIDIQELFRPPHSWREKGNLGQRATWAGYNGAAWDGESMYFHGGGHNDGGMIDVFRVNFVTGVAERIFTAPPYNNLLIRGASDESTEYNARHDDSLPMATHVYDGIEHDPDTGLILVVSGYGYTYGWDLLPPDGLERNGSPGVGVYAFNPTAETVKGISPGGWGRVFDSKIGTYNGMAYAGGGEFVISTDEKMRKYRWNGDLLEVVPGSTVDVPHGGNPTLIVEGGKLIRSNKQHVVEYDVATLKETFRWPVDMATIEHSYTLTLYDPDTLLFFNGYGKITTVTRDGEVKTYSYPRNWDKRGHGPVISKFRSVPGRKGVFVGMVDSREKPFVFQFVPEGGVVAPDYVNKSLQQQVDEGSKTFIPGPYLDGVKIAVPGDFDFAGVERIDRVRNHGYVTIDGAAGGLVVVRNLPELIGGESAIWGQYGARFEIHDLVSTGQAFGIITGNDPDGAHVGEVHIIGGTIKGGKGDNPGKCHNVYIGRSKLAAVDGLTSLGRNDLGHLFKSRADENLIENSMFDGGTTKHSRVLDIPCGGKTVVRNTTLIQSANSDNNDLIGFALESLTNCPQIENKAHELVLDGVTMIGHRPDAKVLNSHFPVKITAINGTTFNGQPYTGN